ncbi:uncharacterized protein VTP21DRAFT_856 [Calcarisporiella thermophila]|uniref:uncharacterized protein n=1 Tax=Calcarisporiella thermophila TaxID=911321 RepID=UPI0037438B9B
MGNDGGSIPRRHELVKEKKKEERPDQNAQQIAQWFYCALSKKLLDLPVVSCGLGKLYNRDAVIEYLLDNSTYGDADKICSHIRSLKDVVTLNLTLNPAYNEKSTSRPVIATNHTMTAQFVCPVTQREMNGNHRFIYFATCGCVLSEQALKEVPSNLCLNCNKEFIEDDIIVINPKPEELEKMRLAMETRKAMASKKEKKKSKKKEKLGTDVSANGVETGVKRKSPPTPPSSGSGSDASIEKKIALDSAPLGAAAIAAKVTEELKAKQKRESAAIRSIFRKDKEEKKGNYLTMGTFTRYVS